MNKRFQVLGPFLPRFSVWNSREVATALIFGNMSPVNGSSADPAVKGWQLPWFRHAQARASQLHSAFLVGAPCCPTFATRKTQKTYCGVPLFRPIFGFGVEVNSSNESDISDWSTTATTLASATTSTTSATSATTSATEDFRNPDFRWPLFPRVGSGLSQLPKEWPWFPVVWGLGGKCGDPSMKAVLAQSHEIRDRDGGN